jgi:uncharacterized protein (TIGR02594 family)
MLPKKYEWLEKEPGPRILKEFLKVYGTLEAPGSANNPTIMWWAKSIGLQKVYTEDSIAWCGLTIAYVAAQAGWDHAPKGNALWALNWLAWGNPVPKGQEMLGDVLVFKRKGGGHVGMYVGEDKDAFHVLGGNTDDQVKIKRILKDRFQGARRCPWRVNQPANIRKIKLSADGELSTNEG